MRFPYFSYLYKIFILSNFKKCTVWLVTHFDFTVWFTFFEWSDFQIFQNFVTQSRTFLFSNKIFDRKRGGIGHRVGPLTRGDSFSSALHNNGFKLITCDSFEKIYGFPTIFELIEDIQNAGESQCALNYRPLHKDMLMAAAGIYQAMYGDEYGIQGMDSRPNTVRHPRLWLRLLNCGWSMDPLSSNV